MLDIRIVGGMVADLSLIHICPAKWAALQLNWVVPRKSEPFAPNRGGGLLIYTLTRERRRVCSNEPIIAAR